MTQCIGILHTANRCTGVFNIQSTFYISNIRTSTFYHWPLMNVEDVLPRWS